MIKEENKKRCRVSSTDHQLSLQGVNMLSCPHPCNLETKKKQKKTQRINNIFINQFKNIVIDINKEAQREKKEILLFEWMKNMFTLPESCFRLSSENCCSTKWLVGPSVTRGMVWCGDTREAEKLPFARMGTLQGRRG